MTRFRGFISSHADLVSLLAYVALALTFLSRTLFGGALDHRLVGGGGDPLGLTWFIAWLPHALGHGELPFFTKLVMAPHGANLLNSTSILLPSLLLWPVTTIGGPVIGYDVLAAAALVLSAWACYFALCRITTHCGSAWLGGAMYGFGSYMAGQSTAHVNLTIAIFPPVAILLIDDIRRQHRPARAGLLLGVCAAAQVFINEEILAMTVLLVCMALAIAAYLAWPARGTRSVYLQAALASACGFAVLAGPTLVYQLYGPEHVSGVIVSSGRYVNDLAGFVVPSSVQLLSSHGTQHLASGFSGQDGEYGAYLGAPMILLLLWAGWRLRRRAVLPGLLFIGAALLSLGPHLHVLGHDTGIWLPWIIPNHLPLLENVVPDRFSLYIWLAAVVLVVLLVDDLRARPLLGHRYLGWLVVGFALVWVLPSRAPTELVTVPRVLSNARLLQEIAPGAKTVLITPFTDGQLAMYAQAGAGFTYGIPDGGVFVPDHGGASYGMRHGPLLYALARLGGRVSTKAGRTHADNQCLDRLARSAPLGSPCRVLYLSSLRVLGVDTVVVTDVGRRSAVRRYTVFFTELLGRPRRSIDATVFRVAGETARGTTR